MVPFSGKLSVAQKSMIIVYLLVLVLIVRFWIQCSHLQHPRWFDSNFIRKYTQQRSTIHTAKSLHSWRNQTILSWYYLPPSMFSFGYAFFLTK
jgi:hypothetical protein